MPSTVWKGVLSFGLVSIPIRLHRAARKERIPLHYVSTRPSESDEVPEPESDNRNNVQPIRSGVQQRLQGGDAEESHEETQISRIRQSLLTEEAAPVSAQDIRRGYEIAPGQYVTFDQPQLQRLRRATSTTMEIVRSVHLAEIDPVFFETSYYVYPEPIGERAYGLLYTALSETGYVALATVAMHGRDHVVLIRPGHRGLLAHTMFYVNEVKPENEYAAKPELTNAKELELAKNFVDVIAAPFAPEEFQDTHNRALQQLINEKTERGEIARRGPAQATSAAPAPPVIDIVEALRKSLELRKPAATAKEGAQAGKGAHSRRKPRKSA